MCFCFMRSFGVIGHTYLRQNHSFTLLQGIWPDFIFIKVTYRVDLDK